MLLDLGGFVILSFKRTVYFLMSGLLCLSAGAGCSLNDLQTPERMEKGLVLILPGIEGRSSWNYELARGLDDGGVGFGIEVYDWGTVVPGGMLINLTDIERNRRVATELRDRIVTYRRAHPRRPVHLIGHSGGGGIAVLTTEMLPSEEPVSSVVLLAAAISPSHDLRAALSHSQYGIFNYYSPLDVVLLRAGTTVAGTIDREHGQSAGAVGFTRPASLTEDEARIYNRKLHQVQWSPEMRFAMNFGGHMDWTHRPFVKQYLAPLVTSVSTWRFDEESTGDSTRHRAEADGNLP
ncbi:MAG: alpha/beta fold hydrolase [Planctomycetes bacterium]|nr:alpha/beta fold hydrolase [Planctomycetota bacterium]